MFAMATEQVNMAAEGLQAPGEAKTAVYKSWKKKYRKMRAQFEQKMRVSEQLYNEEARAADIAKRLLETNDQLLDLLLDVNESIRIPPEQRIDLHEPSGKGKTAVNGSHNSSAPGMKSLAELLENTPHTEIEDVPADMLPSTDNSTSFDSLSYLSSAYEQEYLTRLDVALEEGEASLQKPLPPAPPETAAARRARTSKPANTTNVPNGTSSTTTSLPERDRDIALNNPVSVYNWLKKHRPQFFENETSNSTPNKSAAKSGRTGASTLNPAKSTLTSAKAGDVLDEDGVLAPTELLGDSIAAKQPGSSKRKRDKEEDTSYRPKSGAGGSANGARPTKRRRDKDDTKDKRRSKSSHPRDDVDVPMGDDKPGRIQDVQGRMTVAS